MKIKNCILLSAATLAPLAHGALIFTEGFDYTNGSDLTDNGWSAFSAGGAAGTGTIGAGLTFGSGVTLAVSGGAAEISATDGSSFSNAGFQSADFGGSFTINSGTLWRSFLFSTTDPQALSGSNFGVDSNIVRYDVATDASGNANRIPGSTDSDAEERKFTLNPKNFSGTGVVGHWAHDNGVSGATSALSSGVTYLLISSFDFTTKDNTIWVFDETSGQAVLNARNSGTISAATLDAAVASGFKVTQTDGAATISLTDADSLLVNLAFNGSTTSDLAGTFDEFRLATDLNDAITVVPEPSTYALLGGLMALGMVMYRRRKA